LAAMATIGSLERCVPMDLHDASWSELVCEMKARCDALLVVAERDSLESPGSVLTSVDYQGGPCHVLGLAEYARCRVRPPMEDIVSAPDDRSLD